MKKNGLSFNLVSSQREQAMSEGDNNYSSHGGHTFNDPGGYKNHRGHTLNDPGGHKDHGCHILNDPGGLGNHSRMAARTASSPGLKHTKFKPLMSKIDETIAKSISRNR